MGGEDGCDGSWGIYFVYQTLRWGKTKEQQPWNGPLETIPSRFSLNRKQRSLLLYVICVQYTKFWVEIWNPLIPGQIVNSFGQGKCTFDCQSGNFKNYFSSNHVSTRSCMLRTEKLINFNITCMWTFHANSLLHGLFVSHARTQITVNTFRNDLVLFTAIIQC